MTAGKHHGHIRHVACIQTLGVLHGGQIAETVEPLRSGFRRNCVKKRNRSHVFPDIVPRHVLIQNISVRQKAGIIRVAGNGISARCAVDAVRFQPAHAERKGFGGAVIHGVSHRLPYPRACHSGAVVRRRQLLRRFFHTVGKVDPFAGVGGIIRNVR